MNSLAKKWVEALRSGKYQQGKGSLRDNDKYCCLGVLCEVAVEEGLLAKYDGHEQMLPQTVCSLASLRNIGGSNRVEEDLWELNDNRDWTFDQIANFIESEPEGLFK